MEEENERKLEPEENILIYNEMFISCEEKQENDAAGKAELFDENKDTDKEDQQSIDVKKLSENREGIIKIGIEDSSSEED